MAQHQYRTKQPLVAASTRLMRKANKAQQRALQRRASMTGAASNDCWNAASRAFGWAQEGGLSKSRTALRQAKDFCASR